MDLLVIFGANIVVLPNVSHVAYDDRLHALLIQRGNQLCRLLVLDILDLVFQFPQLLVFGLDQFFTPTGAFLAPTDLLVQMLYQLITILFLGAEQASIGDMGMLTVMGDSHMDLTKINACNFTTHWGTFWFLLSVGGYRFVLLPCPVNNDCLGDTPLPGDDERIIPLSIGKDEITILEPDSLTLVLNAKVPATFAWGMSSWIAFATFSPGCKSRKESLHTGITRMGMELI